MPKERRYMDIVEWQKMGGLQEANRLYFHPHGWALEITRLTDDDDLGPGLTRASEDLADAMIAEAQETGGESASRDEVVALAVNILRRLHPVGTAWISGIWDDSDDPEGVVFGYWQDEYVKKANAVHEERLKHFEARARLFHPSAPGWRAPQSPGEEDDSDVEPFDYVWEKAEE